MHTNTRAGGILLPISSLPTPYGIGTLGREARCFVDFLAQAGQKIWQVLPIGPTGYGDSPYQSFSAFAGNPYFIDLDALCEAGLLKKEEYSTLDWGADAGRVDYGAVYEHRFGVLRIACRRFLESPPEDWTSWCTENAFWLEDYAEYMTAKSLCELRPVTAWPQELRLRTPAALEALRTGHSDELAFWRFTQYCFEKQWQALHAYANQKGVRIMGDIPIYVSPDSADFWAAPNLFEVDSTGMPTRVAGCPPDYFSPDGQLWGNPLYNWAFHAETGYTWWISRIRRALSLYDILRIDHFRGFSGFYAIPADAETARTGNWCIGPGIALFDALSTALGSDLPIVAEDLGMITPDVHELLADCSFPGMKVLQFAFSPDNAYLPHNHIRHCVVYPGTHDNTTAAGWYASADAEERAFATAYLHWPAALSPAEAADGLVRASLASVADTCIIPMADWLGLGEQCRINTPGTASGNWQWRLSAKDWADLTQPAPAQNRPDRPGTPLAASAQAATGTLAQHIAAECVLYGRKAGTPGAE